MIEYKFNEELQILEVFYEGNINFNDLIDYGNSVFSDKSLPRDLRILTDATKSSYNLNPDEIHLLYRELEKHVMPYSWVRAAFIQLSPRETALSFLMEQEISTDKYKHAIFSTRQAALNWLLS